jgi:SAM-dependent methyltransferase
MASTIERFSNRVENYVKYRPDYPKETLHLFREEMNLQNDSVIADIGAGTGISARMFLENGNPVFGVEPNAAMREAAENFLKEFPFHWFDETKTRKEFKRILKKNGFVVLMWNERQLDTTAFLKDYEKLLIEFGTDYQKVRHENITKEILGGFFQADFREAVFQNGQTIDFDGLRGRMLSSSYIPSEGNPRFSEMIKNLELLFATHAENGKIDILYDTRIFYGQI